MTDDRASSPTGRYAIRTSPWEVRMSHWIEPPELIDTVTGRTLLAFVDTTWSLAVATWRSDT